MSEQRNHEEEAKTTYEGGATASTIEERFDLIPYEGMEAAARRFALGASKHGERNWENGGKDFAQARLNHLRKHLALFCDKRQDEDLDAIVCNAMMLCKFRAKGLI